MAHFCRCNQCLYFKANTCSGHQGLAHDSARHGQLQDGGLRLQRGGHQHQVDLAVRGEGENVPNYFSILLQIFFVTGRAQEVRVRLLDGAQDSPRPREVSPALVICLERILDHLCFILIIIVNKM